MDCFAALAMTAKNVSGRNILRKAVWAALAVLMTIGGPVSAQTYPSRPITIIVPFSAGGPSDAMARILAERIKASLGETLLV